MTHLFTAVCFLKRTISLLLAADVSDHYILLFALVTGVFCMVCSVAYHLLKPMCTTIEQYERLLQLDVVAVGLCQTAFYIAAVLCGFCRHAWLPSLLLTAVAMSATVLLFNIFIKSTGIRGLAMGIQMLARWSVHFIRFYFKIGNQQIFVYYFIGELLLLCGVGSIFIIYFYNPPPPRSDKICQYIQGIINVLRVPERFSVSGRFDTLFNSHQIMHILVSIALFVSFNGIAADEAYRYKLLQSS